MKKIEGTDMLDMNTIRHLIEKAFKAAESSYSPYSRFAVGAALLCTDGDIVCGTNVENRSFGLTCCAERTAIFNAISGGKNGQMLLDKKWFRAIAIASPMSTSPLPPCGACRQVLSEFVTKDFIFILAGIDNHITVTMEELFPFDSLHELRES